MTHEVIAVGEAVSRPTALSPLEETFARLAVSNPYLTITMGAPVEGNWTNLADLLNQTTGRFDRQWSAVGSWYKTEIPEVITRFLGGGIVYAVAGAAVGAFARDRRVPDLTPEHVWLGFAEWGSPNAVAFTDDRFVCLPGDDAAGLPNVTTVASVEELRDLLRERLTAIFTPIVSLLRSRAKVGERSLWIGAAESCANALLSSTLMRSTDDETWLRDEVTALICTTDSPLRAYPELTMIEANGRCRLCLMGATCCENFKIPGGSYCSTCPHRHRDERIAAFREWIAGMPA